MSLIDLNIPPGVYRNGTDLQGQGRWRDANLVRWHDGLMRPIGGWRTRSQTAGASKLRGMIAWTGLGGLPVFLGAAFLPVLVIAAVRSASRRWRQSSE